MQERFKHGEGVPSELAIIVGRGQHAQQGGPKLKDTVQQLLEQQLHMNLDQVSATCSSLLQLYPSWWPHYICYRGKASHVISCSHRAEKPAY